MYSQIFLYCLLFVAAYSESTSTTEVPWPSRAQIKVALQCSNGRYINYFKGQKQMECQSERISEWETFIIETVAGHDHVSIQGFRSLLAQVQPDGQGHYTNDVWTNSVSVGPRSTFEKIEHADQSMSFKCINNGFLNRNDDTKLGCTVASVGDASKFKIVEVPT